VEKEPRSVDVRRQGRQTTLDPGRRFVVIILINIFIDLWTSRLLNSN
jgi:hypothetical protein